MLCEPQTRRREVDQLELIFALAPRIAERARRLEFAVHRLRSGVPADDVRCALRVTYGMTQVSAWRMVDMALDLAGPV